MKIKVNLKDLGEVDVLATVDEDFLNFRVYYGPYNITKDLDDETRNEILKKFLEEKQKGEK